jgi:hypothetical protein
MALGGAALLFYEWTANGLPESCGALTEACWRAYLNGGGFLRWSGVLLATIGSIYLVAFTIQMIASASGVGRHGPR